MLEWAIFDKKEHNQEHAQPSSESYVIPPGAKVKRKQKPKTPKHITVWHESDGTFFMMKPHSWSEGSCRQLANSPSKVHNQGETWSCSTSEVVELEERAQHAELATTRELAKHVELLSHKVPAQGQRPYCKKLRIHRVLAYNRKYISPASVVEAERETTTAQANDIHDLQDGVGK